MLSAIFAFVMNIPFVKRARDNLIKIAVAAAVLLVSNLVTGVVFYIKGHNVAAEQCKIGSLNRELKETKRDLATAVDTSAFLNKKLAELQAKQEAREKKDAEDAAKIKPIDGCVVPALPKSRGVRHHSKRK